MRHGYGQMWRDIAKKRKNAVKKAKRRKDTAGVQEAGRQWAGDMRRLINLMKYNARQRRASIPDWENGVPFKVWYPVYLRSSHWQKTRAAAIKKAGHKCEDCGVSGDLQVHHLTYKRLRAELPEDLRVLCGVCHCKAHGIKVSKTVIVEGIALQVSE